MSPLKFSRSMAILVDSIEYTNPFGSTDSFYKSNAGDEMTAVMKIRALIRMSSVGNPLTLDPTTNQVQSAGISWLDAGFRVGQWVYIVKYTSGGAVINFWWSNIVYVDDIICDFGPMPDWYSLTGGEILTMGASMGNGITAALPFDEVDVLFNHQKNGSLESPLSLIDAEVSRARVTGVAALGIGGAIAGILLGNQSGGFLKDVSLQRVMGVDQYFRYEITLTFVNSGMYNDNWFFSSDCLKTSIFSEWSVTPSEPFNRITGTYSLDGDSGYFNEPFNTAINDAVLLQGIPEIDYCLPTNGTIIIDGPLTDIGLGSCYLPQDVTYYKNQVTSQYGLTMIIPTTDESAFAIPVPSELNPSGAGYTIEITAFNQLGSVTTIDVTITPNAALQIFMEGRDPNDRRLMLWVRCGNLNLLAHDGQLQCEPPVGGPLLMLQDYGYLNHCENVTTDFPIGDLTGFIADTEDDVAYLGRFLLTKDQIVESFTVKIEAYNTVTGDDFTLQEIVFAFNTVQISGDGRYLLNESQTVVTTLPNTSEKREAQLTLDPSLDTPTEYGVLIYAPWLLNWKYWLTQNNANVEFYPNQDKNWEHYDNSLSGDWVLRTELSLEIEGLAYTHSNDITVRDYNASKDIVSEIEMYVDSTNTLVNVIPTGNLMRILSRHEKFVPWNPLTTWGMITVEPFESERRWICSTCVDYDSNITNPLKPLSGLLINVTFPNSPQEAVLECFFDPDLIDLTNGVKVTAKIYDGIEDGPIEVHKSTAPDDLQKTTSDDNSDKTLAP
jgi:hypothetical protein